MISKEQEQQVTDYLILHRLPLDILLEVKDHMISQVLDIRIGENLSFDGAFHKTQKLWESEFKMTRYALFYQEEIPMIVKKIVKARYNHILKKSLFYGLISFAVNILFIFLADNQEVYTALFRIFNCLFVLTPFLIWIFNSNMRKYVRRDFKYQGKLFYTMYQQNLGLFIVSINVMFQLMLREDKYAFQFFRTESTVAIFPLILTLVLPFILHTIIIFVLINFFQHKKALTKVQDFLKISAK
ncbi:hypothetical protein QFZ37_000968 [Chryseobacterium ginsenosidimutans]|uniref:hypothetical protein n=1 Tax=Chryseobacterium ginsenosidimutans TaxID=687846 RepID=UPI00277E1E85|nr:hypothetical protein [Chryseobacterium ginsenosidimutans]MDQ0592599.1 hypothetical protein [Chryseobacterium ginsenosidimutans]